MPVISIQSLPFSQEVDMDQVLNVLTEKFAKKFSMDIQHLSAYWRYFEAHHYAVAGKTAKVQSRDSHAVLVELLTPDFIQAEKVESMLLFLALQLSQLTPITKDNIFIEYRCVKSGRVFDNGQIITW